jgi:hypothetical protein
LTHRVPAVALCNAPLELLRWRERPCPPNHPATNPARVIHSTGPHGRIAHDTPCRYASKTTP